MQKILENLKKLLLEKTSAWEEKTKKQEEARKLAMEIQKAQERERQQQLKKQRLFELKRYFSACVVDFYISTQGDVYHIFPHNRYYTGNFIAGKILDTRTKTYMPEKSQREKIAQKILDDIQSCEEFFWEKFAEDSNALQEEIDRLTREMERVFAKDEEARLRGTLSESKHIENENDFCDLRDNRNQLEKELKKRWQIWNAHFAVIDVTFVDDFLELKIKPKQ